MKIEVVIEVEKLISNTSTKRIKKKPVKLFELNRFFIYFQKKQILRLIINQMIDLQY